MKRIPNLDVYTRRDIERKFGRPDPPLWLVRSALAARIKDIRRILTRFIDENDWETETDTEFGILVFAGIRALSAYVFAAERFQAYGYGAGKRNCAGQ